jgi:RimJ/RimL family protein N-acetyltransferase
MPCFLYDIYLDEAYRGQGYGTQTLALLEANMVEKNIDRIGLQVFAHNPRAHALYRKLGYQRTSMIMFKPLRA